MTNPPMNRAVRKVLCKDLVEYGLQLQAPEWGASFMRKSASAPTSPSQLRASARSASSRAQLLHSYRENLRTGRVLKSGSIFSRTAPAGFRSGGGAEEVAPPAHPDWHQYHPFPSTLRPIDGK